jgi:uncharacterized membrane protein YphA (DoxX/SURF4 family)
MSDRTVGSVLKSIGVWAPTVVLGLLFTLQGLAKFPASSPWPAMFKAWGLPSGFHLIVGVAELLGGLLLFVPRLAAYAAAILAAVMVGACLTHLVHGETLQTGFTLGLAALFVLLARVRWSRRWRHSDDPALAPSSSTAE